MEFSVTNHSHRLDISMSGQFTFTYNHKFKQIVALVDNDQLESITLNLKGVDFIDSAGLGMLLLMRDCCMEKNIAVSLRGAHGQVGKILTLSKFDQLFSMES